MAKYSVTMATAETPRFPKVGRHSLSRSVYGTGFAAKGDRKQILPGIGTFVIDSPKDRNSRVRQQCLKYQEAHRGILRAQIEALPDIPKRCVMRSLPIVQLRSTEDTGTSPIQFECSTPPWAPPTPKAPLTPDVRLCELEGKHRAGDKTLQLKRQDSSTKLLTQEELMSRSPIGRVICASGFTKQNGPIAGFGVRNRNKGGSPKLRREYTNLSVNVELAEHGPAPYKATDRELMSQAEYRRQFNFYLGQDGGEGGKPTRSLISGDSGSVDEDRSDIDTCRSLIFNIPANNIGHTSKYNIWASNLRLGEVLSNNATPDLKRKLAGSGGRTSGKWKSSSLQKHPATSDSGNEHEADSYENWMHVVNTPVVDNDIYDRYANVRLSSSRLQARNRIGKW